MILGANPRAQYLACKHEIDQAIQRVLWKGVYILGDEVSGFETEFAEYTGVTFGIGVGNGTDALRIALRACGVGPGDDVITVSHTACATVSAIEQAGARPVLVDIEPDTYTLDPNRLEAAISSGTKAIIPVHLYGHAADISSIMSVAERYGIRVIEDCAQAHGALYRGRRVGSWGHMACFSFYPTKNLGALGDGGMIVTSDPHLAEQARKLREYGWTRGRSCQIPGWNSRLDELQAAVLRVKLLHLDSDNAKRVSIAEKYNVGLAVYKPDLILPTTAPYVKHVYHLYVVRSPVRDSLMDYLNSVGIRVAPHYAVPVHMQPAYLGRSCGGESLPVTEMTAREVLSLPMYPELTDQEIETVIGAVGAFQESIA